MRWLIQANFYFSVLLSVVGGIVVLFKPTFIFTEIMQIYGPLSRNLLLIIFYLVAIQFLLWIFRYRGSGYLEALFVGALFLMTAIGIPVYSRINGLPSSMELITALSYFGLSHVIYFIDTYMRLKKVRDDSFC